jgi:hypothetical protein
MIKTNTLRKARLAAMSARRRGGIPTHQAVAAVMINPGTKITKTIYSENITNELDHRVGKRRVKLLRYGIPKVRKIQINLVLK